VVEERGELGDLKTCFVNSTITTINDRENKSVLIL
jgi:hypothetical protein